MRRGPRERNPARVAALRADERQHALHERDEQREDQREVAELGGHLLQGFRRLARLVERVLRFRRHVVLVVLGQHLARAEHAVGVEPALRDDALALAEQVGEDAACSAPACSCAVSVTTNRTVMLGRACTLPVFTSPPTRNARSFGASPALTCVG